MRIERIVTFINRPEEITEDGEDNLAV